MVSLFQEEIFMILIGILFLGFLIGGFFVIRKFVNSSPGESHYEDKKYRIIGFIFALVLLGVWIVYAFEFFKSYDKAYKILMDNSEVSGSFYAKITNLIIILFEKGRRIPGMRILLLRESYLKFIGSFVGAYLSLFVFWKITNPPDEDLDTNTKFRRIGVIFSIIFVIAFLIIPLFSSVLIFYEYLQ